VVFAFAMAALAVDAGLGFAGGMAGETASGVGFTLHDAEGHVEAVGRLCGVAGGEAQAAGLRVLADAVFDPAAVLFEQQRAGEVAGAEAPLDRGFAANAVAGDGEFGGVITVERAAAFAE
jgi:hypothetical protein